MIIDLSPSDAIRKSIAAGDVTIMGLSEETGITRSTLGRLYRGTSVSSDTIDRLCAHYGIRLSVPKVVAETEVAPLKMGPRKSIT